MESIITETPKFVLAFIRISTIFAAVPFFNNKNYSVIIKVLFALFITLLLFPVLNYSAWIVPASIPGFLILVVQEMITGMLIGLSVLILLFALEMVGHIIGFQMAFSMARAMDSTLNAQTNIMAVIMVLMGSMIFIALRGDHFILMALSGSFDILMPGTIGVTKPVIDGLSDLVVRSFDIGFRISSPAILILLSIDVTLGIIGKTASKMQIFFVGLPLKVSIGMFIVTLTFSFIVSVWGREINFFSARIFDFLGFMKVA